MPAVSSTTSHRQPSNATDNFSQSDFPSLSCRSYIWRRCSLGHQRRHRHSSATWSRDGVHLLSRLSPFSWPSPPHRPPSNGDLLHPVLVFTFIMKHPVVQQYTESRTKWKIKWNLSTLKRYLINNFFQWANRFAWCLSLSLVWCSLISFFIYRRIWRKGYSLYCQREQKKIMRVR